MAGSTLSLLRRASAPVCTLFTAGTTGLTLTLATSAVFPPATAVALGIAAVAFGLAQAKLVSRDIARLNKLIATANHLHNNQHKELEQLRDLCKQHGIDPTFLNHDPNNTTTPSPLVTLLALVEHQNDQRLSFELEVDAASEHRIINAIHASFVPLVQAAVLTRDDLATIRQSLVSVEQTLKQATDHIESILANTERGPSLDMPNPGVLPVDDRQINRYLFRYRRVPLFGREVELELLRAFVESSDPSHIWQFWQGGAGSGKSRLAHELCLEYAGKGWRVGRLPRTYKIDDNEDCLKWLELPLRYDTLIVIDYVSHRPEAAARLICRAWQKASMRGPTSRRLKFVLLDRTVTSSWTDRIRDAISGREEEWIKSAFATPQQIVHYEHQRQAAPLDHRAKSSTELIRYPNTVGQHPDPEETAFRAVYAAMNTIQHVWAETQPLKNVAVDGELMKLVDRIDKKLRPLWAALVTAVAADLTERGGPDVNRTIASLTPEHILNHILRNECTAWTQLGFNEADFNLITLARLVGGLHFDPCNEVLADLIAHGLIPKEPSTALLTTLQGLSTEGSTLSETKFSSNASVNPPPVIFPAMEPDLLGEAYVLGRLTGHDAVRANRRAAVTAPNPTPTLITAAWSIAPRETGWFCVLCAENFPDDPALKQLLAFPPAGDSTARQWFAKAMFTIVARFAERASGDEVFVLRTIAQVDRFDAFARSHHTDREVGIAFAKCLVNVLSELGKLTAAGRYAPDRLLKHLDRLEQVFADSGTDRDVRIRLAKGLVNVLACLGTLATASEYPIEDVLRHLARLEQVFADSDNDREVRRSLAKGLVNVINHLGRLATAGDSVPPNYRHRLAQLLHHLRRLRQVCSCSANDRELRVELAGGLSSVLGHLGSLTARREFAPERLLVYLARLERVFADSENDREIRVLLAQSLVNVLNHVGTLTAAGDGAPPEYRYPPDRLLAHLARLDEVFEASNGDSEVRAALAKGLVNVLSDLAEQMVVGRYAPDRLLVHLARLDKIVADSGNDRELRTELGKGLVNALLGFAAYSQIETKWLDEAVRLAERVYHLADEEPTLELIEQAARADLTIMVRTQGERQARHGVRALEWAVRFPAFEPELRKLWRMLGQVDATYHANLAGVRKQAGAFDPPDGEPGTTG